jgi:hypothetical protein
LKLKLAFLAATALSSALFFQTASAETVARITENASVRAEPDPKSDIVSFAILNNEVEVLGEAGEYYNVSLGGASGYIKSDFLEILSPPIKSFNGAEVELLDWPDVKNIFTIGVDAAVYDVYTGKVYYVRSFSNGLHADVEPVSTEDTRILKETYGGVWRWDPRPVWVSINGRTIAASINGMPHGGGVNGSNGMNGQICLHFKGSFTHNGNASFARDHQNAVYVAYNSAKSN